MLTQHGLNRIPIWPATFARSAAQEKHVSLSFEVPLRGVKGHAKICTRGGREPGNRGYGRRTSIYIYRDSASVESTRGGSLTLAPITRVCRSLACIRITAAHALGSRVDHGWGGARSRAGCLPSESSAIVHVQ